MRRALRRRRRRRRARREERRERPERHRARGVHGAPGAGLPRALPERPRGAAALRLASLSRLLLSPSPSSLDAVVRGRSLPALGQNGGGAAPDSALRLVLLCLAVVGPQAAARSLGLGSQRDSPRDRRVLASPARFGGKGEARGEGPHRRSLSSPPPPARTHRGLGSAFAGATLPVSPREVGDAGNGPPGFQDPPPQGSGAIAPPAAPSPVLSTPHPTSPPLVRK